MIHHIGFAVSNMDWALNYFVSQMGFRCIAVRKQKFDTQLVLVNGLAVFTLIQWNFPVSSNGSQPIQPPHFSFEFDKIFKRKHRVNGFDVSLIVSDVHAAVAKFTHGDESTVLCPATTIMDADGVLTYAVVKSCVGDMCHTLLDVSQYSGVYLPGFEANENDSSSTIVTPPLVLSDAYTSIDHVAYCVRKGDSGRVLKWYEHHFGTQRFYMSPSEGATEGFIVKDNQQGLRLLVTEYWKCAESGFSLTNQSQKVTIVLAESLTGEADQVTNFINTHGGAGLQHIALSTNSIIATVSNLIDSGLPFLEPPRAYYTEEQKQEEVGQVVKKDRELFEKCGILLDVESFTGESGTDKERYIMQAFTKKACEEEGIFFEVIQRYGGAAGFGAGNIKALWKAVANYYD